MNRKRREGLQAIITQLEDAKAALENLTLEEETYRDNIPENMQDSERYEKADEACDALNDAVSQIEDAISGIESAIEG